jgi:hypothetical protein
MATKRDYARTDNFSVDAKISANKKEWFRVQVPNIAAGGLLFITDRQYQLGDLLYFDLRIDPRITIIIPISFNIRGEIKHDRGVEAGKHTYAVTFTEITPNDQIRLDELVRLANVKYGEPLFP